MGQAQYFIHVINALPNYNVLDLSNLKALADDKI